MPEPLSSGYLTRWFEGQILHGGEAVTAGLIAQALAIEAAAKANASHGAHKRGTPTPAQPGSGPAVITGDLRRSITHTRVRIEAGLLTTRVGPADTPHSYKVKSQRIDVHRRGGGGGSTNGVIGLALETGLRGGRRYPFLQQAFSTTLGTVESQFREAWQVTKGVG